MKEALIYNLSYSYNLNIPRYVDSSEKGESWDIYASIFGGIPKSEIDDMEEYWAAFPSLKKEIFAESNTPFSAVKTDDVNSTIASNVDVQEFAANYKTAFSDFADYLQEELINDKRIVFIVDECHRSTFGEMLSTIKETFPGAIFFGFTGTPIQDENQRKMSTTADVFGNELHRYSIADGIRDKNVLGFDPYMVCTYKDNDVRRAVALEQAKAATEEEALADPKKSKVYYHYMDHTAVPMAGYVDNLGQYVKGIEDYVPMS